MHCRPLPNAMPHGHGLAARMSWKRAGNRAAPSDRRIEISPLSSGCRKRVVHARAELERLVDEQHAVVGQADRAWLDQPGAAADHGRHGVGVVAEPGTAAW